MSSKYIFFIVLFVAVFGLIMSISNTNDLTGQADKTLKKLDDKRNPPKPGDFKEKPKSNSYASLGQGTFEISTIPIPLPISPEEFIVNEFGVGVTQKKPKVEASNDKFVVVWIDSKFDSVHARVFSGITGSPLTGNIDVGALTADTEVERIDVGMTDDDSFMIVWQEEDYNIDEANIKGRIYDATFNPIGAPFNVNDPGSTENWWMDMPHVTALSNGNFAVLWEHEIYPGSDLAVVRVIDSTGNVIETYETETSVIEDIDAAYNDEFIITYRVHDQATSITSHYAQRFTNDGIPIGSAVVITEDTEHYAEVRLVPTYLYDGSIVITWQRFNLDTTESSIFAQHFDSVLNPMNTEFQVNDQPHFINNVFPQIKEKKYRDGYVVVWHSGYANWGSDAFARVFDNQDTPLTSDITVNTLPGGQGIPAISAYRSGYVTVWSGDAPLDTHDEIFAQRFDNADNRVY